MSKTCDSRLMNQSRCDKSMTICTIGHSNRSLEQLIAMLRAHDVQAIADVRSFPSSKRFPHFNREALEQTLPEYGIAYLSFKTLGGRRRPDPDSINTAWRVEGFRAYADFMQTDDFVAHLNQLTGEAQQRLTAIMCAEAVPWRCHRSLIADALLARNWRVLDIFDEKTIKPHQFPDFAHIDGMNVTYPAETLFSESQQE